MAADCRIIHHAELAPPITADCTLQLDVVAVSGRQAFQLGRLDEARAAVELFLVGNPHFTTSHWATTEPFRDAATLEHFVDGYRKAGLPE
jgi:hypothetical protein